MKKDVIHSTDNNIRPFDKWETGLLLRQNRKSNPKADGGAENDSNFCNTVLCQDPLSAENGFGISW